MCSALDKSCDFRHNLGINFKGEAMKISVLTIFPEFFDSFLKSPVIKRGIDKGLCDIEIVDIKNFAHGSFRHIDDSPFGGGPGMVMRCQPIFDALNSVCSEESHKILLSPKGKTYSQSKAREFASVEHIVLVCGHYEGVDARVEEWIDEQLSIGDYVLTGGEIAAQVVVDSIVRLLDGVLRDGSTTEESHENGLLEYPQYTQPREFNGLSVPEVLLSGHKAKIDDWRLTQSLLLTRELRPDMFEKYELNKREKKLLDAADNDKKLNS